ncbi:MAG: alpha-L-arabinofuranosidase C-terminal domain-containing protein [Acidobacteriaceae bacterium]
MDRRVFVKTAAMTGAAVALSRGKMCSAATADSRIELLLGEPIATISPLVYGHFTEHLGGVIYDGVWVGEGSKVGNTRGIRSALVDAMKAIKAPVIRWPGGCFADSYDWKDGIGPRAQRPKRTNFWADAGEGKTLGNGAWKYEPNEFGTSEFIDFCKQSGAEPYLAANVRSLPALDFDHWVEYCNSPAGTTTLAEMRGRAGFREPHNVKYWGVGNESWGCGGNFQPEEYANEFRKYTTWVPDYGVGLKFIGSGPNVDDFDWSTRFFESLYRGRQYHPPSFWGWSIHHYAENLGMGKEEDWIKRKGDAVQFDEGQYWELLREADRMEGIVTGHWNAIGAFDKEHRVKLVVDEYGPWYKPGSEVDPSHLLGQQVTVRDAIVTALTLDTFNRHAEKVGAAACAQLINCLNSLFLAHGDRFVKTPNFDVFQMYAAHQGATAVRAEFSAPQASWERMGKTASFWGLKGSASVNGKQATITVVNPHLTQARETVIAVRGGNVGSVKATVLADQDIHAHNTFEQAERVRAKAGQGGRVEGNEVRFTFPPASVTQVVVGLA